MQHRLTHQPWILIIAVAMMVSALGATPAVAANTAFSGQATAVKVTLLGQPITVSDTGALPPEGGQQEASLLAADIPGGFGTVEVLHATTVGQGNRSRSEASAANLSLNAAGNTIAAEFLMARATAVCEGNGSSSVSGDSEVVSLMINGQPVSVGTEPNQRIDLPGGVTVIINEQSGSSSDITVNALHVVIAGVGDVIIASAHSDVKCAQPVCDSAKDFVTGGGWINGPSGSKANLAIAGGIKNGVFWGHLQYIDHGNGMKVKGTAITAYMIVDGTVRHIEGTCEIDGRSGHTFKADVGDNGEPGRDTDTFNLVLSNGYGAAGKLAGGNIQLHTSCR